MWIFAFPSNSRDIFRSAISVEQQRIDDVNRYDMDCLIFENEQNVNTIFKKTRARKKTPQRSDNLGPRGESPGHELVSEVFGRLRNYSSGTSLEISFDMIGFAAKYLGSLVMNASRQKLAGFVYKSEWTF